MSSAEEQLQPNYFFANPKYQALLEDCTYVWQAVSKIKNFINQQLKDIKSPIIEDGALIDKGATIIGDVTIKAGAKIDNHAYIEGPAIIDSNTRIFPHTFIGPNTIIGKNCQIKSFTFIREETYIGDDCIIRGEIKHSVLMDKTNFSHGDYIGDSIIGENCNIGAGVVISNSKNDLSKVTVKFGDKKLKTDLEKFGAIWGDGVKVGCNAVTNPGTIIGKNVLIYPLAHLQGFYESNRIIKVKEGKQEIIERK